MQLGDSETHLIILGLAGFHLQRNKTEYQRVVCESQEGPILPSSMTISEPQTLADSPYYHTLGHAIWIIWVSQIRKLVPCRSLKLLGNKQRLTMNTLLGSISSTKHTFGFSPYTFYLYHTLKGRFLNMSVSSNVWPLQIFGGLGELVIKVLVPL